MGFMAYNGECKMLGLLSMMDTEKLAKVLNLTMDQAIFLQEVCDRERAKCAGSSNGANYGG